jgi:hypothetical protein
MSGLTLSYRQTQSMTDGSPCSTALAGPLKGEKVWDYLILQDLLLLVANFICVTEKTP